MREAVVTEETCIDVNCPTCNPRRSSASGVTEPMTDARLEEIRSAAAFHPRYLEGQVAFELLDEVDRLRQFAYVAEVDRMAGRMNKMEALAEAAKAVADASMERAREERPDLYFSALDWLDQKLAALEETP